MDALGHVNNTQHFRYMEQARIEWLYALADGHGYAGDTGPVIVNASCTFIEPLVYPGDVQVTVSLDNPGRTSIGRFYEIHRDGRKAADGAARIVWIELANGRPTPLPGMVRALLPARAGA